MINERRTFKNLERDSDKLELLVELTKGESLSMSEDTDITWISEEASTVSHAKAVLENELRKNVFILLTSIGVARPEPSTTLFHGYRPLG